MAKTRLLTLWVALGLVTSAGALGQTAWIERWASLRAGPDRDYPRVARIPPGTPVEVIGCLDDWAWCDIIVGPDRGWVWSGNLVYPYGDHRVRIIEIGPDIGLPIVRFTFGPYWDSYYRTRPWYSRRYYWSRRPARPRRPWVRPPNARPRPRPPAVARPPVPRPPVARPPRPSVRPARPVKPPKPRAARPHAGRPRKPPRPPDPN